MVIRHSVSSSIFSTSIHALICSRIDYYNFLLIDVPSSLSNSVGPQFSCKVDSPLFPVLSHSTYMFDELRCHDYLSTLAYIFKSSL